MTRSLYVFAIFVTALYVVMGFIHTVIYVQLGREAYFLESFSAWFTLGYVLSNLGLLLFLKYCHYKKYTLVFNAGIFSAIAGLVQFIVVVSTLNGVAAMATYYLPAYILVLVTALIFSLCLTLSKTRMQPWLRGAGIFSFILAVVLLSAVVWYANSEDLQNLVTLEKIHQWTGFAGSLALILFIMNFMSELKLLGKEKMESPSPPVLWLDSALLILGSLALVGTLILASSVTIETRSKVSWERQLSVRAKEWAQLFEARNYANTKGETLKYQLLKPLDYDPQKRYPLVVCLPYGGGVEGCPPAQMLLTDVNRRNYPAFLYVPFCPDGAGWGGIPNYPTIDSLVFESIDSLTAKVSGIDKKRLYVTGVSRGGYGSWHFISARPKMFAAAVPVCGGGDPMLASKLAGVAVWAFHGEDDRNVPVSRSRDMITAMKAAGANPKYTEYPDVAHNVWDRVMAQPGLLDWLFAQTRN